MTLQELQDWIKSAEYITSQDEFTDSCGNYEVTSVYRKDGKYYVIEFQNEHPYSRYVKGKGLIHGEYDIHEAVKESGMQYWENYRII